MDVKLNGRKIVNPMVKFLIGLAMIPLAAIVVFIIFFFVLPLTLLVVIPAGIFMIAVLVLLGVTQGLMSKTEVKNSTTLRVNGKEVDPTSPEGKVIIKEMRKDMVENSRRMREQMDDMNKDMRKSMEEMTDSMFPEKRDKNK